MLSKAFFKSLFNLFSRSIWNYPLQTSQSRKYVTRPSLKSRIPMEKIEGKTLLCDIHGGLLRSSSLFPYFMLMAFEGGGPFRGLLLLVLYPFICLLNEETGISIMVFISFCGIKEKDGIRVQKTVMPKYFLEDVGMEGFEILKKAKKSICVTALPRVMVEGFLRDYLQVDKALGREMVVVDGYYTGSMVFTEEKPIEDDDEDNNIIGLSSFNKAIDPRLSICKEVFYITEEERKQWSPLPKSMYPQPFIFHDIRMAFRPTPISTLIMYTYIPLGLLLALIRFLLIITVPQNILLFTLSLTGMRLRLKNTFSDSNTPADAETNSRKRVVYVCNHRDNFDALYVTACLDKKVTAVTYGIARPVEMFSPFSTVRLSRSRDQDRQIMNKRLAQEDLLVFPEGTTCREPFLLRFSSLFAELCDEVFPVAIFNEVTMFNGNTANGYKILDATMHLMNPFVCYNIEILEKISTADHESKRDVTNKAREEIARALGFQCVGLTRKDKYLTLSGHEGVIPNWFHPNLAKSEM